MRPGAILATAALASVLACTERKSEPVGSSSTAQPTVEPQSPSLSKPAPRPEAPAPTASMPPGVPPLLPGETPPTKGPNYFEPGEMGTTGMATAYQSCLSSVEQTDADMPTWKEVPYCSCIVDAWRSNIHTSGDPDIAPRPTREQVQRCGKLDGGAGPFAVAFPKDTPSLYNSWKTCIEKHADLDHGVYCGCYTDGVFKNPRFLVIAPADDERCKVADQYWAATRKHMTVRQFQALGLLGNAKP